MNFNEYQYFAGRTAPTSLEDTTVNPENIKNFCMGLSGEAGEVVDYLKKVLYHGHPLELDNLKSELGDILWYVSAIALEYNIYLEEIAQCNIEKLEKRYPNGFSESDSMKRVDVE